MHGRDDKNFKKTLVGKLGVKRPLGRYRHRRKYII
jgi:hypothetical protein